MELNQGNLVIHYHSEKADYKGWSIWLWEFPQRAGKQFEFEGRDSFGILAKIPLSNWTKNAIYNNLGKPLISKILRTSRKTLTRRLPKPKWIMSPIKRN